MKHAARPLTTTDHGATQMVHACMPRFLPSQAHQVPAGFIVRVAANAWTNGCTLQMVRHTWHAVKPQIILDHGARPMVHASMLIGLPLMMRPANGGFTVELAVNAWRVGSTQMMNRLTRDAPQPLTMKDHGAIQTAHALVQILLTLTL